jgi:hypothetical protein
MGAIAHASRSHLLFIRGTMTAQRYINEVLGPIAASYVRTIEEGIFQQDTAPLHVARASSTFLRKKSNCCYDLDLSRFEKVWDTMEKFIDDLPHPPRNLEEL